MLECFFTIEMFKIAITVVVENNHYQHYFGLLHGRASMLFSFSNRFQRIFCCHCIKNNTEIVCQTNYFSKFVCGNHSDIYLQLFVYQHLKILRILQSPSLQMFIICRTRVIIMVYTCMKQSAIITLFLTILMRYVVELCRWGMTNQSK